MDVPSLLCVFSALFYLPMYVCAYEILHLLQLPVFFCSSTAVLVLVILLVEVVLYFIVT